MTQLASDAEVGAVTRHRHAHALPPPIRFLWRLVRDKPMGAVGLVLILGFLGLALVATVAPGVLPYGYNEQDISQRLQGPSSEHWFGTDQFGRDVFSRVVYGARVSVTVSFSAVLLGVFCATALGMISGYIGGWFDTLFQRVVDVFMSIPRIVLLLVLVSYARPSIETVIWALAFSIAFRGARIVRGSVIALKQSMYVEGARVVGAVPPRIMLVHILPNIFPVLLVMITVDIGAVILAEASLSFLGLGVPPPVPSWGSMISERQFMFRAPWMSLWPGLALALTVYAWNVFGDALRDMLDPRLRGSRGRAN